MKANDIAITIFIILMLTWLAVPYLAQASDRYKHRPPETTVENTINVINVTHRTEMKVSQKASGVALAGSMSMLQFDASTKKNQLSIGAFTYEDQDAISIGLGKKFDNITIHGAIGAEGDTVGAGAGIHLTF